VWIETTTGHGLRTRVHMNLARSSRGGRDPGGPPFPDRPMVGHPAVNRSIPVRILVGEPKHAAAWRTRTRRSQDGAVARAHIVVGAMDFTPRLETCGRDTRMRQEHAARFLAADSLSRRFRERRPAGSRAPGARCCYRGPGSPAANSPAAAGERKCDSECFGGSNPR
jgi:hypothetical protein